MSEKTAKANPEQAKVVVEQKPVEVVKPTKESLDFAFDTAIKAKDKAAIKVAIKAIELFERVEAEAKKAEEAKAWQEQATKRDALVKVISSEMEPIANKHYEEILKLIGLDNALLVARYDFKARLIIVSLARSEPKAKTPSTGNGKRGKIQALFEQYATSDEKAALQAAIDIARAKNPMCRVDGIEFVHRTAVKKRLIVAGIIPPQAV
jgi:hypothetical protein